MTQWELANGWTSEEDIIHWQRTDDSPPALGSRCLTKRLCVSASTCVKRVWPHRKLGTAYKGMQRATEDKSGPKRGKKAGEGENVHERCVWCGTYCSRTHRSGRGSPVLRHTDNLPGCRCDRSGIQTAQEHTCHQGPWWLQTFSTTLITHRQRRRFRVQSLIEDPTCALPSCPSCPSPTEQHGHSHRPLVGSFQKQKRELTVTVVRKSEGETRKDA